MDILDKIKASARACNTMLTEESLKDRTTRELLACVHPNERYELAKEARDADKLPEYEFAAIRHKLLTQGYS